MNDVLFGLETEYAFTPFDHHGAALDRTLYSQRLVTLAARRYRSLYGDNWHDLFLSNGGRLYVDAGLGLINIEYSTPECTRPEELIGHVRAGDRLLASLARQLEREHVELKTAFISKTNFDYCGHTSGSHENYLHSSTQTLLAPHIVPHLVSRVIYTGGGGFNDFAENVEYLLSPRVPFLEHICSAGTQDGRAIFNTREEALADTKYGRLHLLCGEGVRYDMTEYLRLGTTALIVKLIELGVSPANGIELEPLPAINTVARDINCRAVIGSIEGAPAKAIDIQRHYLQRVRRLARRRYPILPNWAESLCNHWEEILAGLEADPMRLVGVLDWPTKLALYRDFANTRGFEWSQLSQQTGQPKRDIRAALCELDIRLGDISEQALFATLQSSAGTAHRLVPETLIATSEHLPPQATRAKLRGHWIEQLTQGSKRNRSSRCNWDYIRDDQLNLYLDMKDPFATLQARP